MAVSTPGLVFIGPRMSGPRAYSAGTRAALAYLSRGACYNPDCGRRQPIIEWRGDDPYIDYQIAHIRDAKWTPSQATVSWRT